MEYRPKNSFSMNCASRKVIFPGVAEEEASEEAAALKEIEAHEVKQATLVDNAICLFL